MGLLKIIFVVALTTALSIAVTIKTINDFDEKPPFDEHSSKGLSTNEENNNNDQDNPILLPSKRLGRFLASNNISPRAAGYCKKDDEICYALGGAKKYTHAAHIKCCKNKCTDMFYDKHNCGACGHTCELTQECCRGKCVYLAFDKRHCGMCNNRCPKGGLCVYGMCEYA